MPISNPEKFQDKYRVKSTRLPKWDYANNGHYFITICTDNMNCCFGEVKKGLVFLNDSGEIVRHSLLEISRHFPFTDLTEFAVMPNHVHLVLTVDNNFISDTEKYFELFPIEMVTGGMFEDDTVVLTDKKLICGAGGGGGGGGGGGRQGGAIVSTNAVNITTKRFQDHGKNTVSSIIGAFKSFCSKNIRKNFDKNFYWQKGFWDHLIKDEESFVKIVNYIINNPAKWERDRNNKPGLWY